MSILPRIVLLLVCHIAIVCRAQELPPIRNFSPSAYQSENQNWSISQASDKVMFIANNQGLLEYNGAEWLLYPSPNETKMRSVKVIGDKVYTGCYMEFGYWERNAKGKLEYTSLSKKLQVNLKEDEEFWSIEEVEDWILFQSLSTIYIYSRVEDWIIPINAETNITKMFKVGEDIYYHRLGAGIFKIVNGKGVPYSQLELLQREEVVGMFQGANNPLLLTRNNGFFEIVDGALVPWVKLNAELKGASVYCALRLADGSFAIGTISKGLILVNSEGVVTCFNQGSGLLNNTILSVFEDTDGNIWTGLDNGISFINLSAPVEVFNDNDGIVGSIYASAIHEGYLYFGTNQGLFYKPLNTDSSFEFIEETQGQVWSLQVVDETLFCAHHTGTYVVNGGNAAKIEGTYGTWSVSTLPVNDSFIIQGSYDGLYVLEKVGANWKLRNKLKGFDNSSRYFEVTDKRIFVNHEYKGIFNVTVDSLYRKVLRIDTDTLLRGANSSISKFQDDILYIYKEGVFKYDKETSNFLKDSLLSQAFAPSDYISGRTIINNDKDEFWIFTESDIVNVSSQNLTETPKIKHLPLSLDVRKDIIEYENILNLDGANKYLIGSSTGYLIVDVDELTVDEFKIYLSSISNGINADHSVSDRLVNRDAEASFESDENNLRIKFHTPEYYAYFKPYYQFQLVGLYDVWSEWSETTTVFFENLPAGKYTFNVRAKIGDKVSSNIASYSFKIEKQWYLSNGMIFIYIIVIVVFVLAMHTIYRRYYKNQQRKLIEANKREIELAKLQNEKEIIKIRNEKLEEDFKSKSKELAASTMNIIKNNELLNQIKDSLLQIDNRKALNPVIKIIDKNLNGGQNWELFEEAFNNADSEFFKKMKGQHPDLSPNDLKLCAYLRLNLSSKEIAPLFNISPRSVEIKRYRLRKKLNLDTNENLTSYILSI